MKFRTHILLSRKEIKEIKNIKFYSEISGSEELQNATIDSLLNDFVFSDFCKKRHYP